jgi:Mrp family chromosome partitioning ATPase
MSTNGNTNGNGANSVSSWVRSLKDRLAGHEQEQTQYRRLALQLHCDLPRGEAPRSVLLVTPTDSALSAHGSTVLACCLAEELHRPVLLIDSSIRRSEATQILNCANRPGFSDLLSDSGPVLEELVLPTSSENVFFLPVGNNPNGRLTSPQDLKRHLKAAENRYDFVLLSGGSLLDDAAALAVAPSVGCVLLLVIEAQTALSDMRSAETTLEACKARKVGLVLTTPVRSNGKSQRASSGGDTLFRIGG